MEPRAGVWSGLILVSFCFSIRDLLKFKEEVTKERDQLLSEVVKLREALAQSTEQQQETERNREDAEQTITQVSLRLSRAPRRNSAGGCPSPGSLPFSFLFDVYLLGPKESIHHSAHFFFIFSYWSNFCRHIFQCSLLEVSKAGKYL